MISLGDGYAVTTGRDLKRESQELGNNSSKVHLK